MTLQQHFRYPGGGTKITIYLEWRVSIKEIRVSASAGIAEMLLQSHLGEIHLLPALPDIWKEGKIKGLKARGNFEVTIEWKGHRLTKANITSLAGGICSIRTTIPVRIEGIIVKPVRDNNGYTLVFNTQKGKTYKVSAETAGF